MRKYNIVCPIGKSNSYCRMMKASQKHTIVPNTLNREFKQGLVGKLLLTDITYLTYDESNRAYLSTIKDVSTNEILSCYISESFAIDIVTEIVKKLMRNNKNFTL
ncbi:integrase catalytic subunit [Clostridium carnis]|uniref:Integrase catalytic subunit n=1 Tax=Clostridium carnis TaxID=1530 RepID=A0ABY6SUX1_9CLOT|nr:hypothetical protein [Clostridium carnis]VDG72425.1 integrase catalytic subunit [Clostridium carnis]